MCSPITYALRKGAAPHVKYPDLIRRFEEMTKPPTLAEVRRAVREIRASKGMLLVEGDPDCRSAGSFFKNPILPEADYARLQADAQEPFRDILPAQEWSRHLPHGLSSDQASARDLRLAAPVYRPGTLWRW